MERKLDTKLMQAFGEETFTFNRKIVGGTTSRRPDWYRRCTGVNLIIELDQHQHKSYANDDETVRLTELMHDFNRNESENKPMVVIRFNTDEYIDESGNSVAGCIKKDGTLNELKFTRRWLQLKKRVERWLYTSDAPFRLMRIERLFFDGYDAVRETTSLTTCARACAISTTLSTRDQQTRATSTRSSLVIGLARPFLT